MKASRNSAICNQIRCDFEKETPHFFGNKTEWGFPKQSRSLLLKMPETSFKWSTSHFKTALIKLTYKQIHLEDVLFTDALDRHDR